MAEESEAQTLRGRALGGARFPRHSLKEALPWAKKLVSKTHTGAVSAEILYASVVNSKGTRGKIKLSAMRQYELVDGQNDSLTASELSKKISYADESELPKLYSQAALAPTIFKGLFDTFHGDDVSLIKLKQRAVELNVHPDNADQCISLYVESLSLAGLLSEHGDKIVHVRAGENLPISADSPDDVIRDDEHDLGSDVPTEMDNATDKGQDFRELNLDDDEDTRPPRAIFNVNVSLDSSLDTDKLEKQLALLKRFGAI